MNQLPRPAISFILLVILTTLIYLLIPDCIDVEPLKLNSPTTAAVAIEFLQADTQALRNVEDVRVSLIDPAGQVVTPTGKSIDTLVLSKGLISLALKDGTDVGASRPYRFHLRAEAEGYLATVKTILLRNTSPKYYSVFMASIADPPPGMNTKKEKIELSQDGDLDFEVPIATTKDNNAIGEMMIMIPPGSKFYSDGALVGLGDTAIVELAYVNALSPVAGRSFPGFLVTDAVDTLGEPLASPTEPLFLNTIGWYSIDINFEDGTRVDSLSKGITVDYEINPFIKNPLDTMDFSGGESVQLWRLDEKTGAWQLQQEVTLVASAGGSLASFKVDQLSTHALTVSTEEDICSNPIQVRVRNPYPVARQKFCQLINSADGTPFSFSLADGGELLTFEADIATEILISSAPLQDCVNFLMYDYAADDPVIPGQLQGVVNGYDVFTTCLIESEDIVTPSCGINNVPPVEMTLLAPDDTDCVTFNFDIRFSGSTLPICNNAIWYKQCNACTSDTPLECLEQPFKFAGILESGELTSPKFDPSEQYCLRLWYVGVDPSNPNSLIEQIIDFHINLQYDIYDGNGRQVLPDPSPWFSTTNSKIEWQKSSADPCGHDYRILIDNKDGLLTDNAGNTIQEILSCEEASSLDDGDSDEG